MSKTYKCSYMGWTYGVMGETQITASRAMYVRGIYNKKNMT